MCISPEPLKASLPLACISGGHSHHRMIKFYKKRELSLFVVPSKKDRRYPPCYVHYNDLKFMSSKEEQRACSKPKLSPSYQMFLSKYCVTMISVEIQQQLSEVSTRIHCVEQLEKRNIHPDPLM
jgi:hypothetical protein